MNGLLCWLEEKNRLIRQEMRFQYGKPVSSHDAQD